MHGNLDGFLRKILRLKVTKSNNNPVVPGSYFHKFVRKCNLVPDILRADCGNENFLMGGMQCTLANETDAHRYGSSLNKKF